MTGLSHIPIVGVTCDTIDNRSVCPNTYINAISQAGGAPLLLPNLPELAPEYASTCDAFVFTGGEDPDMTPFGETTHAAATRVDPQRQKFETALLNELNEKHKDKPALCVCLGMQWMAMLAGGALDQHLPDQVRTHADHANDSVHAIEPAFPGAWIPTGSVTSKHHQAVSDSGSLRVVARAHDGVIEAIDDPERRFYRGVQWHPERTTNAPLGADLYRALIAAVRG